MKTCTNCLELKPFTDFYPEGERLRPECKACTKAKNKVAKAKRKKKVQEPRVTRLPDRFLCY